jgi:hypothetical protein
MICQILGYEHDKTIDETILGLMTILCPPDAIMYAKLDYCQFLAEIMHFQLSNFHSAKTFRYQSYLVYLILFNNVSHFENLGIQPVSDSGTHKSVIDWTIEVRRKYQTKGLSAL